jgi:hypothetical protein
MSTTSGEHKPVLETLEIKESWLSRIGNRVYGPSPFFRKCTVQEHWNLARMPNAENSKWPDHVLFEALPCPLNVKFRHPTYRT